MTSVKDWKAAMLSPSMTILDALKVIDHSSIQIGFVVDSDYRLMGTVTDGDVRRSLIKGATLAQPVSNIMHSRPIAAGVHIKTAGLMALMKEKEVRCLPIVTDDGKIQDVVFMDDLLVNGFQESWVVLMAGGFGTRLSPLTDSCPKPLIKVGGKPMLETTIKQFSKSGFRRFFVSVNYRADMIRDYFGDGSRWNVSIEYLHEKQPLGTAGSLSLLPELPPGPLIVMNGDVLTNLDFGSLLEFHDAQKAIATMAVRKYEVQVPYGVVRVEDDFITEMSEKPTKSFFVNAGIYVLSSDAVGMVAKDEYLDMPTLFHQFIDRKVKTAAYPIRGYWADIGRHEELRRVNSDFEGVFDYQS